jgi:hypothetical protein
MIPTMWSKLNKKTLFLTTIGVFAFIFVSDFIIHSKILDQTYRETGALWRTDDDMKHYCAWMIWGQFWMSALFTTIFAMGYEGKGIKEGVRYGFLAGLLLTSTTFMQYAVMPLPQTLLFSWLFWGVLQFIGAGVVAWWVWNKVQTTWNWKTT